MILLQEPTVSSFNTFLPDIVKGVIAVFVSGMTFAITNYLKNRQFSNAYKPKKLKKHESKNTILVIGLGRVGKSQMIETLFKQFPVVSHQITDRFSIHQAEKKFDNSSIRFVLTDYRGQNFAQLIQNFIEEQLEPNTLLRYGDINTLILVVDIFEFEKDIEIQHEKPDYNRIKEHVEQWNRTALDAVFGLLTKESLQYVCLFINKSDKLKQNNPDVRQDIETNFSKLIEGLKTRAEQSNATFEVIIGSALTGDHMIGPSSITTSLNKFSVPVNVK